MSSERAVYMVAAVVCRRGAEFLKATATDLEALAAAAGAGDEGPHTGRTMLLDAADAAELLKVSAATVSRLAASGALPHSRVGHALRFVESDLIAWLRDQSRSKLPNPRESEEATRRKAS